MSNQQQFECKLYLEKKEATKIVKAIGRAGFVEAEHMRSHLPINNFRVVIYHEGLKKVVGEAIKRNHIEWVEKDLTVKEE